MIGRLNTTAGWSRASPPALSRVAPESPAGTRRSTSATARLQSGRLPLFLVLLLFLFFPLVSIAQSAAPRSLVLEPRGGATPETKHVVLLSGDEEYRSEEALPMLAKILSQRHGFKSTVLFALDPDGTINPDNARSPGDAAALDSADVIIMALRFRAWPEAEMKHFVDAYRRGVPIIALRTSTHAFRFPDGPHQEYNDFGKNVLGERWVSHWGKHKAEATRGVIEPSAANHPLLRGVEDVFGTSDVYEAAPPADATILLRGLVLRGMKPGDEPAGYRKTRKSDGVEQPVNDPPMPIAWTRLHRNRAGKQNRVLTTTMGAATDLENEGLRRLIVNGVYWALGREAPARADVRYIDPYEPRMYGFKGYRTGLTPADHALGKKLPPGGLPPASPGATASPPPKSDSALLTLAPNEHIALIGNGLADRMQHHGWLETLIHAKFPGHQLVFRNLAVAGDEVATRARSANFGTPDEWLTRVGADVVFAFFGYNESFAGAEGLPQFKEELAAFLRHTLEQRYRNGAAPRIVLFSPLAAEHLPDPDRALPPRLDDNLSLYTAAMAEVARDHPGVIFVNLHAPSQRLYAEAAREGQSLTFNGVHLTAAGDAAFAPVIFEALFGEKPPTSAGLERLRDAVNDKSAMWHSRYRTVDGYNVYGGRSKLAFPSGAEGSTITNFEVMQQEMSQRDVLTANRDRRTWAVAQGSDVILDQSNLPPVAEVPTNLPGPNPDKSHDFIGGEEAIALMNVSPGLEVNLFASEEMFPELAQPVQMAWDTRGRLWVAAWNNYPERTPTSREGDRLLVFEDTDHDGRADKCTTFLDDLNCPTGFQFYRDGVLVMQAPDLWFVRDTDGDGRADWRERVLMGMDSADSHHTANSLIYTPGGAIFLSDGVFHRSQVETTRGVVRNIDAAIYRFEPVTGRFEVYASYAFANPHGRAFDRWGNDLIVDATGNHTYFGAAFSGHIDYPAKHPRMKTIWDRPMRPSAASAIITSRYFPDEFEGNFLNGNVIGFQGFYRVKLVDDGSGIRGERLPDFLSSSDPNFRPVALSVGPDGAVYFLDWHNPIIGHMQHHIRDPNRDKAHGRIYRVTYAGRPLLEPPKIHDQPIPALLELLKEPENHIRELAKIELGRHPSEKVMAALRSWVDALDPRHPDSQHHLTEALWVCQWQNVVNEPLLRRMLRSPSADARAAATRVLCYWREHVPGALELLRVQADDEHPRVRLHAVRAASFFREPAAIEVALIAARHPIDYHLDYTLGETVRQLRPFWGGDLLTDTDLDPTETAFLLRGLSPDELLDLPRKPAVLEQIVQRPGFSGADRAAALSELAAARETPPSEIVLEMFSASADNDRAALARLLLAQPAADLQAVRTDLEGLSRNDVLDARSAGWAALAIADGSFDQIWPRAAERPESLALLLEGIPEILDPELRARAQPRVLPLLEAPAGAEGDATSDEAERILRAAIEAAVAARTEPENVFRALGRLIVEGREIPAAAAALRRIPGAHWAASDLPAITDALLRWGKSTPPESRADLSCVDTLATLEALAGALPAARQVSLRAELRDLRVPVFIIRAVPEQLRYDLTRIVMEPEQKVRLTFENPDVMPHNLVIVRPGKREAIGLAALQLAPDHRDRHGRAYVPESEDVLAATRMLETGESAVLDFRAPDEEGVYEYVCTFPGHWMVMWGRFIVTRHPESIKTPPPESTLTTAADHAH